MTAAALTGISYIVCNQALGLSVIPSTVIAFFVGFGFRLLSQWFGWEEWEPWEPAESAAGEKARKTLGEGLHAEFRPKS